MLHPIEGEHAHELIEREDLLRRARVPAEQGQVVEQRLRQIALLAIEEQVELRVLALGHLAPVVGEDQGHVRVGLRPRVTESVDDHQLVWRVGEMLLTADHVRDLHGGVVYRARIVVGGKGI